MQGRNKVLLNGLGMLDIISSQSNLQVNRCCPEGRIRVIWFRIRPMTMFRFQVWFWVSLSVSVSASARVRLSVSVNISVSLDGLSLAWMIIRV